MQEGSEKEDPTCEAKLGFEIQESRCLESRSPPGTEQGPCLLWLCRRTRFGETGCCQKAGYLQLCRKV